MRAHRPLSAPEIQGIVAAIDPDAALLESTAMAGGLSSSMAKVTVESPAGITSFVVRSARGEDSDRRSLSIADEYALIETLHRLGLPVATPRHVGQLDRDGRPQQVAVHDYVDGRPRFEKDPALAGARFAETLVRLHSVDPDSLPRLPGRTDVITAALASPPATVDETIDEARIRAHLDDLWPPPRTDRRLLHGDYFPGNVLWCGDGIVAVIDWEDAAVGDPLADVATTRLDLLWAYGPEAVEAFTRTYVEQAGVATTGLPAWDLVAALRPAGDISLWAADWGELGRPDIDPTTMRARHRDFVDDAISRASRRTT